MPPTSLAITARSFHIASATVRPKPSCKLFCTTQAEIARAAERLRKAFEGRTIWNVNSTARGGGVAEMLQSLLAYARGAGVDTRWIVIRGDARFFEITKRIHNGLHGSAGDGGALGPTERAHYEAVLRENANELRALVKPGDVVLLHDPQTLGLVEALHGCEAVVVWRCHVGYDGLDEDVAAATWEFLRRWVDQADAWVFSRDGFAPRWLDRARLHVIPPSIDPFSAKNQPMEPAVVRAILAHVGILNAEPGLPAPAFVRRDGSPGRVDRATMIVAGHGFPTRCARPTHLASRRPLRPAGGDMDVRRNLTALLEGIQRGEILATFDRFYADDVVMSENGADERRGKAANRAYEEAFVSNVTFHGVALGRVLVDGDSSAYEMTLEFTPKGGGRVVQRQVAVQSWRDGKIVRETFYHA